MVKPPKRPLTGLLARAKTEAQHNVGQNNLAKSAMRSRGVIPEPIHTLKEHR